MSITFPALKTVGEIYEKNGSPGQGKNGIGPKGD